MRTPTVAILKLWQLKALRICHISARREALVERDMSGFFERRRRDEASRLDSALLTKGGYVTSLICLQNAPRSRGKEVSEVALRKTSFLARRAATHSSRSLNGWPRFCKYARWLAGWHLASEVPHTKTWASENSMLGIRREWATRAWVLGSLSSSLQRSRVGGRLAGTRTCVGAKNGADCAGR
ncbi:hypothetical protein GY45DRAFT_644014 [Cubamyces sp. BRFM 1775]|nr:hypothetical protein GY45DRAFT_644014 [Cubamyces sp. BRFM 1775]